MVDSVIFYNHYHNGDLFHSKTFVDELVQQLRYVYGHNVNFYYTHRMHPDVLKDMHHAGIVAYDPYTIQRLNDKGQVAFIGNKLFINTWVGAYFGLGLPHDGECNIDFNMAMWDHIFKYVSKSINQSLNWSTNPKHKLPYVNKTNCNIAGIEEHMRKYRFSVPKVLFCNGPVYSGQCPWNNSMSGLITSLANEHPAMNFYYTHKIEPNMPNNCYYTGDIIKQPGCDLNEISILSNYCGLIVGRFSGPFCFTATSKNLIMPDQNIKRWYGIGVDEKLWWPKLTFFAGSRFHFRKWESQITTDLDIYNDLNELLKRESIV